LRAPKTLRKALADQGMIILAFLFEVTVSFQKLEAYGAI
jgi:hypothetical protein